jgi:hypothetical protein
MTGAMMTIDTGANQETVTIVTFSTSTNSLQAVFTKTHLANVPVFFSSPQTLVFDIAAGGWVIDVYQYPATLHILEEGPTINGVLCGNVDGSVRPLNDSGAETCTSVLLLPSFNAGDVRASKHFSDIFIEGEIIP